MRSSQDIEPTTKEPNTNDIDSCMGRGECFYRTKDKITHGECLDLCTKDERCNAVSLNPITSWEQGTSHAFPQKIPGLTELKETHGEYNLSKGHEHRLTDKCKLLHIPEYDEGVVSNYEGDSTNLQCYTIDKDKEFPFHKEDDPWYFAKAQCDDQHDLRTKNQPTSTTARHAYSNNTRKATHPRCLGVTHEFDQICSEYTDVTSCEDMDKMCIYTNTNNGVDLYIDSNISVI